MARKAIKEVRGLSIFLQGIRLILPDSIVLQILPSADVSPVDNAPDWLLGTINWHKLTVPALSFEAASNHQYNPMEDPRMMVLKSINNQHTKNAFLCDSSFRYPKTRQDE
jgi:chemosensory pili system protein ChpC